MPKPGKNKPSRHSGIKKRAHNLKQRYGLSLDDYASMFANQNGCCAICGYCTFELEKMLVVDHEHKRKRVRGLLCHWCNSMIGFAKDNIKILKKAIAYLEKNR